MEEKSELNDIILNKNISSTNNKKIVLAVATLGIILIVVIMLMNTITSKGTDNLPRAVLPPAPEIKKSKIAENEPLFEEVPVVQDGPQSTTQNGPQSTTQNRPQNTTQSGDSLEKIAQKLKEESKKEAMQEIVPHEIANASKVEAAPVSEGVKKEKIRESAPVHEVAKKEKIKEVPAPQETLKKEKTKEIVVPKEVIKKEKVKDVLPPKEVLKREVPETSRIVIKPSQELKSDVAQVFYIQVGSFVKNEPNKNLLESVEKLGYKYKFHKVKNDSTELSKVLVGPFGSDKEAREALKALRGSVEPGAFLTKIQ